MKTLILVRHGKSSWVHPELADFDRPLLPRGERDAHLIGRFLYRHHMHPDLIKASPAQRASATARILAAELHYELEEIESVAAIYEASVADLFAVVRDTPRRVDTLLLVGHNPGFSELADTLADASVEILPTGGTAIVELPIEDWGDARPGAGHLRLVERPKHLRA